MNHQERTTIEMLRRIGDIEKKISKTEGNKTTLLHGTDTYSLSSNDHRLLGNLNSEGYMHLTGDEYRSVVLGAGDHGSLTGLRDNDHPQYVRHAIAGYEWDMLASERNPVTGNIVFVRKGIDDIRSKIVEKLFPQIDSIDSMVFYKSDETTPVLVIDTLNERVGIGLQPQSTLDIDGSARITNGNLEFFADRVAEIYSNIGIKLHGSGDVTLSSQDGDVVLSSGTNMRSETFAQDTYGWSVHNSGDAYFRNIKVNKINARIVSTGIEQYVGGRQTMCKSASPLTADLTVPAPESNCMLHVEPFADYPLVNVFEDGDIVRLMSVSLYDGKYNTSDCWGTVVFSSFDAPGEQVYTFTRSASPNSGSANAGATVQAGELALNFGVSGDGYIVSTVV